ncbi:thymidine kinase [Fructobacillus sp. M1-13]|uniref:Thymidine kinase n=1 Tax=Fructobacillus papyriferae TaxID=2713171 RepID=A0ABS5QQC2_9LACO|nr:thymidine kinase [Fructobacillus papyriferae]MBS9335310.1 thymidine kinase [Fructobacillus papyriferae]MCD2159021.1 thymidine kinase [Fructobacillus papyriferae]
MAQLYFEYGAMGSGKSIEILKVAHNYESQGKEVLLLTPLVNDRDGVGMIASRIGLKRPARVISPDANLFEMIDEERKKRDLAAVLVDEAQFLQKEQVDQLAQVVDDYHLPVMTFGLKQDAFNELFEGAKRLIEMADKLVEMKTICSFCGRKATTQLRFKDGKPQYEGAQIQIGGDEAYKPVCRIHWYHPDLNMLKKQKEM